ncbi:uncharacterized protein LOC143581846 [Bidens hawaiensis]|uniref:uncharacterized protein LOC143581846 n=1 Tax=Bidens hawaiensis TaxID=980011 RepID=UPI00404B7783
MVEQFLLKYFPPDKTAKYRANITGLKTDEDESLHAAWERYKGLLRICPHHGLNKWLQVQTFFDDQSSQNKQAIDQIAGGDLGTKSPNEAFEVLEKAAKKSFAYNPPRSTSSHKGMHHVDSNTLVTAQLETLSKKFEQLQTELVKAKTKCETCGGEHKTKYCQQIMMVEDVDYVSRQNNTFGNTYNPGWRNHPNFSGKDGANNQTPPRLCNPRCGRGQICTPHLRRPLLAIARALIDVCTSKLTLRVEDEEVTFDIGRSMKHPQHTDDSVYYIDVCESIVSFHLRETIEKEACNTQLIEKKSYTILHEEQSTEDQEANDHQDAYETIDRKLEPKAKTSVEDPTVLELKELPSHLEYAFLDGESQLPVIISSSLSNEEKKRLLEVLKLHKKAIAWKIMDIKGISQSFCTRKILMEEDFKPVVQHQRRLNPNMQDVVKKEVIKLLDAGLIYPISDSPWVSPVQVVLKKGGMTVVTNDKNELIPMRTVTGWRVCINYRKLNDATRKDHFSLPFIDQMLERLSGRMYYYFLDGFSRYFQIPISPENQEKMTFTCPYGTFAYRRMPFGLCNAIATFQCCMVAIFHDMIEDSMKVFMDDFSVF